MAKAKYQLFDKLRPEEHAALKADIKKRGVKVPIEMDDQDNILDGHNRVAIAEELGLDYETIVREFATESEKREHVIKLNLARRHLDPVRWGLAFKMLIAERGARPGEGGDRKSPATVAGDAIADIAEEVGVSERTARHRVAQANVYKALPAKDRKRVESGEATVQQVKREQREATREARRDENRAVVTGAKSLEQAVKAKFATIVLDPPWDWGDEGDVNQLGRAKADYATMPIEQIEALPVGDRADEDCHLYLWITNRSLPKGFRLLDAWGFRYVTCLTWCKPSFGMGNYFRGSTEQILFGVKGSQPLKRKDVGTWFEWARPSKQHSSKPAEFFELVESCSPSPYLEMFARGPRDGWVTWGAEASAGV